MKMRDFYYNTGVSETGIERAARECSKEQPDFFGSGSNHIDIVDCVKCGMAKFIYQVDLSGKCWKCGHNHKKGRGKRETPLKMRNKSIVVKWSKL